MINLYMEACIKVMLFWSRPLRSGHWFTVFIQKWLTIDLFVNMFIMMWQHYFVIFVSLNAINANCICAQQAHYILSGFSIPRTRKKPYLPFVHMWATFRTCFQRQAVSIMIQPFLIAGLKTSAQKSNTTPLQLQQMFCTYKMRIAKKSSTKIGI